MVDDQGFALRANFKYDEVTRKQYTDAAQHVMTNPIRAELIRTLQATADYLLEEREMKHQADLRRREDRRRRHERQEREKRERQEAERRMACSPRHRGGHYPDSDDEDGEQNSREWRDERRSSRLPPHHLGTHLYSDG